MKELKVGESLLKQLSKMVVEVASLRIIQYV